MKRENIETRIRKFFDTYDEPGKSEYIDYCINEFDKWKKSCPKDCDTVNIQRAITVTIVEFGL